MNRIIFLFIYAFLPLAGSAQINLVRNPSFEDYTHCPDMVDEAKYSTYWMSLDSAWTPPDFIHAPAGVPEYCNICSTYPDASVPYPGSIYPRTGNGMMQVQMFYDQLDTGVWSRDYLQGHLSETLSEGKTYFLSFFICSEEYAPYVINHIGAYLDDGTIDTTHSPGRPQTQYTPQVLDSSVIYDTLLKWVRISGTFVSNGTERIITIGNFSDRAHTSFVAVQDTTGSFGSGGFIEPYLVDDVSVIDCSNVPFAGNDTMIHPGDSAFLGPHEGLLPYIWYKLGSSTAIDSGGGIWVKPTVTTTYVLEQNLCGINKFDTVVVHVWPDTVATTSTPGPFSTSGEEVTVYPNPATGRVNVAGAAGCNLSIYDVVGRLVFSAASLAPVQVLDIAELRGGVYFVRVVDNEHGGVRVVRLVVE